jgi:hypothetical protein
MIKNLFSGGLNILEATSQILSLKRANADYVIAHSGVGQTIILLRDARKFGYSPTQHKPKQFSQFYKTDLDKAIFVPITGWLKPLERK